MEDYEQRTGWPIWVLGGLTLLFLTGTLYYWNQNKGLNLKNNQTTQRVDSLQLVKGQLEKDIQELNGQLTTTGADNTDLTKQIEAATLRLNRTDASLLRIKRTSTERVRTIGQLNQRIVNLTGVADSLTNQMIAMDGKIGWMADSNTTLVSRNEQLGREVGDLRDTLLTRVPRTTLTGDGFRVEAAKSNQKETAKAKKVNSLTVSFSVPPELGLTGRQDVYLSLTDEAKKEMVPPLRTATINLQSASKEIPVHATQAVEFGPSMPRISFQLSPETTIKPGMYRAAVYTDSVYLGSVEFQFRDSFWFF